jgi:SulP family sulfate permease
VSNKPSPGIQRNTATGLSRWFPCVAWLREYDRAAGLDDGMAALVVTVMLIPQSLAYAMLAGLPPQVGLYASILPLIAYGLFGTSRVLAVGPVAVVSLMTASAVGAIAVRGSPEYLAAAVALAFMSGLMLVAMGVARLGFLANFLSHPVISGFISASGILIAASQVRHVLGIEGQGHNLVTILSSLVDGIGDINGATLLIGTGTIAFLFWVRLSLKPLLLRYGVSARAADGLTRAGPVVVVTMATSLTYWLGLAANGVKVVGDVPAGLPPLAMPPLDFALWRELALAALLISVIGFVESISVAQTLAAKKRQRIVPNQELIGLGAANLGAAFGGGYPVTGGFARSVVNHDAGAVTPAAGMFTALGITLVALYLTPLLYHLPKAALAATIIVAVLSLVDVGAIRHTWRYSRSDAMAMIVTMAGALTFGVEAGVLSGVGLSIALHLWRTSRPHWAVVGQVPGTEHFRNVERHAVNTVPEVLSIRIDESLYFPNARFLEDLIGEQVALAPKVAHVVLMCPAVNVVDSSAIESLQAISERLAASGVQLHLSEVKGPVLDSLSRSGFLEHLTGSVHLSQYHALQALAPEATRATLNQDTG